MSQLHEWRVIQLSNLIFGPVVARSTSIDSSPHCSLGFWSWRRSCRYRGEGVIDRRAERSHASHGSDGVGSQASCWRPLREQTQRHGYRSIGCGKGVWYGQYNPPYKMLLLQRSQRDSTALLFRPHSPLAFGSQTTRETPPKL